MCFYIKDSQKYNDIREVDRLVNTEVDFSQEAFGLLGGSDGALFRRIIIAKLSGNQLLEEIVQFIEIISKK